MPQNLSSSYIMRSLSNIDLGENQLWNPVIHPSASPPVGPSIGQLYFDTVELTLKIWIGSSWMSVAVGTGGSATASDNSLLVEGSSGSTLLI